MFSFESLGQTGYKLTVNGRVLFIDPYLSNSVERLEGEELKRMVPIRIEPDQISDAEWVLVTHIHLDHCDLDTLLPISNASPQCCFLGSFEVIEYLAENGISVDRLKVAPQEWFTLCPGLRVHATPSAHPTHEEDEAGNWRYLGFVLESDGKRVYHSGDTFVTKKLIDFMEQFKSIQMAMLPVNEHNFFKEEMGIIGNMSVRDAFSFAELMKVDQLVPMHWDMFSPNQVYKEEIELIYNKLKPDFELVFEPTSV